MTTSMGANSLASLKQEIERSWNMMLRRGRWVLWNGVGSRICQGNMEDSVIGSYVCLILFLLTIPLIYTMQLGVPNLNSLAQLIVITVLYFTPSFATKLSTQLDADHSRPLWSRRIKKRLFEHLAVVGLKEFNMDKEAAAEEPTQQAVVCRSYYISPLGFIQI